MLWGLAATAVELAKGILLSLQGPMGDAGHHCVGLCPRPSHWSWIGGCPRVEAQRVPSTIDHRVLFHAANIHACTFPEFLPAPNGVIVVHSNLCLNCAGQVQAVQHQYGVFQVGTYQHRRIVGIQQLNEKNTTSYTNHQKMSEKHIREAYCSTKQNTPYQYCLQDLHPQ